MKVQIKRVLKACLIVILILFILVIVLVNGCSACKQKEMEKDSAEQSAICDTIPYIMEQPEIVISGFYDEEIDTIRFQILRNRQLINDTLVKSQFTYESESSAYKTMKIPYDYFLKTDTIVAMTQSGLYYYISGYHHYAYMHYGMFGYLGSSDCRFSENCVVNGVQYDYKGTLNKYRGWKDPGNRDIRIYKDTPEFEAFEKKMPLTYEDAYKIFVDKMNDYSPTFLYCEKEYYIFGKDKDNVRKESGIYDIYKISARTGEFIKVDDSPLISTEEITKIKPLVKKWTDFYGIDLAQMQLAAKDSICLDCPPDTLDVYYSAYTPEQNTSNRVEVFYSPDKRCYIDIGICCETINGKHYDTGMYDDSQAIYFTDRKLRHNHLLFYWGISTGIESVFWENKDTFVLVGRNFGEPETEFFLYTYNIPLRTRTHYRITIPGFEKKNYRLEVLMKEKGIIIKY